MDSWFHFLYAVIWPFFNLIRPIRAVGRENIPDGPAVICPNHTTIGRPLLCGIRLRTEAIPCGPWPRSRLCRCPVIGWLLGKAGVFGVDRGHADMKAVKTALKFLKDGTSC